MKKEYKSKGRQKKIYNKIVGIIVVVVMVVLGSMIMFLQDSPSNEKLDNDKSTDTTELEQSFNNDESIDATELLDTEQSQEEENTIPELKKQTKAEYEKWLAAAVVTTLSIEYPDFELKGIYHTTSTELDEKEKSEGVYVVFESNGENMTAHSIPLKEERTKANTMDIKTMNLGFATFDLVDENVVSIDTMKSILVDDIANLISETMQLTVYKH